MARNPRRPAKKRGRPSSYSRAVVEKITQSLELGLPLKYACLANGVRAGTFSNWVADHPDLARLGQNPKVQGSNRKGNSQQGTGTAQKSRAWRSLGQCCLDRSSAVARQIR